MYGVVGGECEVPQHFWGDYYSIERGDNLDTLINAQSLTNKYITNGLCDEYKVEESTVDARGRFDAKILFFDRQVTYFLMISWSKHSASKIKTKLSSCGNFTNTCKSIVSLFT